jgi:PilZ domain
MHALRSQDEMALADARAAERRRVSIRALVREAGTSRVDIDVVDLSATGFRFESLYSFAIGARVFLSVPTLAPLEAEIAWRKGSAFGCRFVRPLYPAVFDMLAARFG